MKKINIFIIVLSFFLCRSIIFADINTLFYMDIYDRNIPVNTNTGVYSNELFIEQTVLGGFNYIKFNLETKLYYRLYMYKDMSSFLFKNTKAVLSTHMLRSTALIVSWWNPSTINV